MPNYQLILLLEDTNFPFQTLSKDPYGIYALVLTPTRELAFQIADQFKVAGSPIGLRVSIVVGGRDMVEQVQGSDKVKYSTIARLLYSIHIIFML